jgi:hypothetical protein
MGWRRGSSVGAPVQLVQSPEFKPQYCQKEKKISKLVLNTRRHILDEVIFLRIKPLV